MEKKAYPQVVDFWVQENPRGHLDKWEQIRKRVLLSKRSYPNYSIEDIISKYTKEWPEKEKYDFIQWFDLKNHGDDKKYKSFEIQSSNEGYNMTRFANTIDVTSDEKLKELRQKLRNRINSADKILQRIYDLGLLGTDDKATQKVEYLSNILQKLKNEILTLKRPELIVARHNRVTKLFKKAEFFEVADFLQGSKEIVAEFRGKREIKAQAISPEVIMQIEKVKEILIKEAAILSFDRIKNLIKVIDFLDKHNLSYTDPLKKAINTLLKPLDSSSNDIYEVISNLNKLTVKSNVEKVDNAL